MLERKAGLPPAPPAMTTLYSASVAGVLKLHYSRINGAVGGLRSHDTTITNGLLFQAELQQRITPAGVKSGRYKIVCRFSRRSYRPDALASDPCGRRKKNGEKHNAYVLRRAKECRPCPSLYILNDSTDRLCKSMKNSYFLKRLHPSFFHICDVSE